MPLHTCWRLMVLCFLKAAWSGFRRDQHKVGHSTKHSLRQTSWLKPIWCITIRDGAWILFMETIGFVYFSKVSPLAVKKIYRVEYNYIYFIFLSLQMQRSKRRRGRSGSVPQRTDEICFYFKPAKGKKTVEKCPLPPFQPGFLFICTVGWHL